MRCLRTSCWPSSTVGGGRDCRIFLGRAAGIACAAAVFDSCRGSRLPAAAAVVAGGWGTPAAGALGAQQRLGRHGFSNLPEAAVYSGPSAPSAAKRFTLRQLRAKYQAGTPISMLTAYDYPSAVHVRTPPPPPPPGRHAPSLDAPHTTVMSRNPGITLVSCRLELARPSCAAMKLKGAGSFRRAHALALFLQTCDGPCTMPCYWSSAARVERDGRSCYESDWVDTDQWLQAYRDGSLHRPLAPGTAAGALKTYSHMTWRGQPWCLAAGQALVTSGADGVPSPPGGGGRGGDRWRRRGWTCCWWATRRRWWSTATTPRCPSPWTRCLSTPAPSPAGLAGLPIPPALSPQPRPSTQRVGISSAVAQPQIRRCEGHDRGQQSIFCARHVQQADCRRHSLSAD